MLWLPPYHLDINPIEEAWGIAKGHVSFENDGSQAFDQVKDLLYQGFNKVDWRPLVRRVHEHEEKYIKSDDIRQPEIGVDIIMLDSSSSSSSEEEDKDEDVDEQGSMEGEDFWEVEARFN